jgi:hypothetical protein
MKITTPNVDTIIQGDCREEMKIKTITSIFDWQNDIIDVKCVDTEFW